MATKKSASQPKDEKHLPIVARDPYLQPYENAPQEQTMDLAGMGSKRYCYLYQR